MQGLLPSPSLNQMRKKFITYLFFNGLTLFVSAISVPIITSYLTPEEYGRLGVAISLMVLLMPIITFSAVSLVQVERLHLSDSDYKLFFDTLKSSSFIVTLLLLLICWLFVQFLDIDAIILFIPFLCLFSGLRALKTSEMVILDKPFIFGIINISVGITTVLLTVLFLEFIAATAEYRLAAMLLAEALIMIIILYKVILNFQINTVYLRDILKFGWPLMLSTAPSWALTEAGRIILLQEYNLEAVGYYSLALQIGLIYMHFNNAIGNAIMSDTYKNISKSLSFSSISTAILFQLISLSCIVAVIYLFGDYYINDNYKRVYEVLWYVICGFFIQSLSLLPAFCVTYYKRTDLRLIALTLAAITTVSVSYLSVSTLGLQGIGFGLISGFTVFTALMFIFARYLIKKMHYG